MVYVSIVQVVLEIVVVVAFGRFGLALATAPVEATAAAETTAAAGDAEAEDHEELAPLAVGKQVGFDVLLAKLLGQLQAHAAVLVVDLSLGFIAENAVGLINFLEFGFGFEIVRVLVRMVSERQFSVSFLDVFLSRVFRNTEHFVQMLPFCTHTSLHDD